MNNRIKILFGLLFFGTVMPTNAQLTKDSLLGAFTGTYIVTIDTDTVNNIDSLTFEYRDHEGPCEVDSYLNGEFDNKLFVRTFQLGFCERESYEVNRDSLLSVGATAPLLYFFGKDSVLFLVADYDANMKWWTFEFQGVRDPNYQSISPPLTQQDLKVFPNPANNQVTIQFPELGTLKVFNMLGQVQVNVPFSEEYQLNVEHWSEGVYIVELEVEGAKIRQRVVVQ